MVWNPAKKPIREEKRKSDQSATFDRLVISFDWLDSDDLRLICHIAVNRKVEISTKDKR